MNRNGLFLVVIILFQGVFTLAHAGTVTVDFENAKDALGNENWFSSGYGEVYQGPGTDCDYLPDYTGYDPHLLNMGNGVTITNVQMGAQPDWVGSYWGCFSVSSVTGVSGTPDGSSNFWLQDLNQYAAYLNANNTTSGNGGSNYYLVAYDGDACGFGPCPMIYFDESVSVQSFYLNNTNWAVNGALGGDSFAREFVAGDWFRLTVTGRDGDGTITGVKDIILIDYLGDSLNYITDWTQVDLTNVSSVDDAIYLDESGAYLNSYGSTPEDVERFIEQLIAGEVTNTFEGVEALEFRVSGTDGGMWGLNIAAYFALDDLVYWVADSIPDGAGLPEPSTLWLSIVGVVSVSYFRKSPKRQ